MYPIFITDDPEAEVDIPTLPGQKRWGINRLEGFLRPLVEKGLKSVILFGVPLELEKVRTGSAADEQSAKKIQTGRSRYTRGFRCYARRPGPQAPLKTLPPTSPRGRCLPL